MSPEPRKWYRTQAAVLGFHLLFWMILLVLPGFFRRPDDKANGINWHAIFNVRYLTLIAASMVFFYLNAFAFMPMLFSRKRIGAYAGVTLLTVAGLIVALSQFPNDQGRHGLQRESFFLIFPFLFYWAMSTAYRFFSDQVKTEQLLKERENENLKTELSFLRSQVSPHFLFNVLNNMVAMARLRSDQLEPSLIRLSGLMRYMLYESDVSRVPLSREVEYVNSYIELQKLRYDSSLTICTELDPGGDGLIEPMLLIPFIENAFKHGTGMIPDPVIEIGLQIEDGRLHFTVRNKMDSGGPVGKDGVSGIGLYNVQRRLNLLYAGQHELTIRKDHGWFDVSLRLKLHTV